MVESQNIKKATSDAVNSLDFFREQLFRIDSEVVEQVRQALTRALDVSPQLEQIMRRQAHQSSEMILQLRQSMKTAYEGYLSSVSHSSHLIQAQAQANEETFLGIAKMVQELTEGLKVSLAEVHSANLLNQLKGPYIGREGSLSSGLLEALKAAPKEQKRELGAAINVLKNEWEGAIKAKQAELDSVAKKAEAWDPTLPPPLPPRGALHPLDRLMGRMVDAFRPLGYHVEEGPEIETAANNFDGLNIPEDHPARGSSDTFYLAEHPELLLRTHTSPVQVRVLARYGAKDKDGVSLLEKKGGLRFLAPGRVYRKDEIDPTHSPMFHQIEGMLVGKNIGLHHLKGTLSYAMRALFGPGTKARFRPSYFPFVEPGCEMDVSCPLCGGKGCRVCKGSGWVEILGAGLIHPNVLEHAGIDPRVWSGFAFGMGVERTAMMVSQTPDLRLFFENDQRFLSAMGGLD